jgi:hypothetical protein
MKALALFTAVLLAGCAAPRPQPSSADKLVAVASASDLELCLGMVSGRGDAELRGYMNQAIMERRIDCNQYAGLIQARMQADAARQAALLGRLLPPVAPVQMQPLPPLRPAVTCTTLSGSIVSTTTCN